MTDTIIEMYKRQVDRTALRKNLKLTVDQRLAKCEAEPRRRAQLESPPRPSVTDDHPGWEPISDCSADRETDPIIELYKCDVDRTLLRENLKRTPDERLQELEKMMGLVDELRKNKAGGGPYDQLVDHSERVNVFGADVQCLTLEKLIETKRAAGRPKDFEVIAELEALLEERDKDRGG